MSKFQDLFSQNPLRVAIYTVVGYPNIDASFEVLEGLTSDSVDIIELGMPFSDPVADGTVIQEAHFKALEFGVTLEHLFAASKFIRERSKKPIVAMGY